MNIQPKIRGFICTTAHPAGCAQHIQEQIGYAKTHPIADGPKNVLVIGASTGYGLACTITAVFSCGANTLGIAFERPASGNRTATAGWYNVRALEQAALAEDKLHRYINGDAFSTAIKEQAIAEIRESFPGGKIDLVIYSVAAPKRTDPQTGITHTSVLKPIGQTYSNKTVDFHTGKVTDAVIAPAEEGDVENTVAVMGGADWLLWMQALLAADVLQQGAATIAFSYIGPGMTHAIYQNGTIGMAKKDLEIKAKELDALLVPIAGKAFVSVNKALVTQASAAIPVVPLYIALLYRQMKQKGTHEDCIMQMVRMFADRLYPPNRTTGWTHTPVDDAGRIRMDDWELAEDIQQAIAEIWPSISTEALVDLGDLDGYRRDFYRLFGFGLDGVDYAADSTDL